MYLRIELFLFTYWNVIRLFSTLVLKIILHTLGAMKTFGYKIPWAPIPVGFFSCACSRVKWVQASVSFMWNIHSAGHFLSGCISVESYGYLLQLVVSYDFLYQIKQGRRTKLIFLVVSTWHHKRSDLIVLFIRFISNRNFRVLAILMVRYFLPNVLYCMESCIS